MQKMALKALQEIGPKQDQHKRTKKTSGYRHCAVPLLLTGYFSIRLIFQPTEVIYCLFSGHFLVTQFLMASPSTLRRRVTVLVTVLAIVVFVLVTVVTVEVVVTCRAVQLGKR